MARRTGAINSVIVQPDGTLKGFNNDGFDHIQSLLDVWLKIVAAQVCMCLPIVRRLAFSMTFMDSDQPLNFNLINSFGESL